MGKKAEEDRNKKGREPIWPFLRNCVIVCRFGAHAAARAVHAWCGEGGRAGANQAAEKKRAPAKQTDEKE